MKQSIGKRIWAIAEGYIPAWSNGPAPEFTSHEAFCILNATDDEAHIELTIFYADREPVGLTKSRSRRAERIIFDSIISPIRSRFRSARVTRACSSRTRRSSCSTRGSTRGRRRMRCLARSPFLGLSEPFDAFRHQEWQSRKRGEKDSHPDEKPAATRESPCDPPGRGRCGFSSTLGPGKEGINGPVLTAGRRVSCRSLPPVRV